MPRSLFLLSILLFSSLPSGLIVGRVTRLVAAEPGGAAGKQVTVSNVREFVQALRAADPGSAVLLAPGEYRGALYFDSIRGEDGRPITVAAKDPKDPPVFRGEAECLHFSDSCHLEIRDLVLEGSRTNGLNIDDGGTPGTPAHHVTLRRIVVRDVGTRGNQDGIKLSGLDDFRIEDCTVMRWGRGGSAIDMVGCHRGVIERCTFRDQEKTPAANAIQTKGGSRDIAVRECRFEHAGQRAVNIGGSTGLAYFRPRPEGYEAKNIVVEGCTFVGSPAPVAFVGVDGATVRRNTFYRPRRWFIRVLQETRGADFVPCRRGKFVENLIVFRAREIVTPVNVGPGTAPETFTFARNYWYAEDDPSRSLPRLPVGETDRRGGKDPRLRDPEKGDLRLREGSPARGAGADGFRARS